MIGATREATPAWRLRPRVRNRVLVVHVLSAGAWIGIDVVMAVLVFTALLTDDDRTKVGTRYRLVRCWGVYKPWGRIRRRPTDTADR